MNPIDYIVLGVAITCGLAALILIFCVTVVNRHLNDPRNCLIFGHVQSKTKAERESEHYTQDNVEGVFWICKRCGKHYVRN